MKKICFILIFFGCFLMAQDRALVIGIENYKNVSKTPGCVNDADLIKSFLINEYNFKTSDIIQLKDENATRENILAEMNRLIKDTKPGGKVFISYSGHGTQAIDLNGDEADGQDEAIVPYDVTVLPNNQGFEHLIIDDELEEIFNQLQNRRTVALFDCCHSGTLSRSMTSTGARFLMNPSVLSRELINVDKKDIVSDDIIDNHNNITESGYITYLYAANPNQKAWPLKFNDKYYGILSFSFTETFKKNIDIKAAKERMLRLATLNINQHNNDVRSLNKGEVIDQTPNLEIAYSMLDQPLFDKPLEQAIEVLVTDIKNDNSAYKLQISTLQGKREFYYGKNQKDIVNFVINSNKQGYLYIFMQDKQTNKWQRFFPEKGRDFMIPAGNTVFPKLEDDFELVCEAPEGRDKFLFVVISGKNMFNEIIGKFDLSDNSIEMKQAVRGWAKKSVSKEDDWQADIIELITIKK